MVWFNVQHAMLWRMHCSVHAVSIAHRWKILKRLSNDWGVLISAGMAVVSG